MIYDVILVGIFLLLIIINAHRGAAKALAGLVCSMISYLAATALGKIVSTLIYDSIVRPAVDKAVVDALNNTASNTLESVTDSIPAWIAGILKLNSIDLSSIVNQNSSVVTKAVNDALRPAAVSLISFLVTILFFFIIYFLLRVVVMNPVLRLFELPVIRGVNRFFGAVIGFIDAFLLVSLLAYLLRLLMPAINSQGGILNESTIYNSFIFYHFYSGNIFTAITSAIGL